MPIQTNFAVETAFFHVPIPATAAQVRRLNDIWRRQPPRNGRIVAKHTTRGLKLVIAKPVVLIAVADDYWREIGRLITRTGEPWWDICAIVTDSTPVRKKPHAHALSLYRITAKGEMQFLHSDTPEALWPEQYPVMRKRARSARETKALARKWKFAADAIGMFEGPKNFSRRKVKGSVAAPVEHVAQTWGKLDRQDYSPLSLAGSLGKSRARVGIRRLKAGAKFAMAQAGHKVLVKSRQPPT
jgi:hypothetical protein